MAITTNMLDLINLLSYPFMQRALIAGLLIAILGGLMGVFALLRKGAFFGDAIAHSSLAGVAVGLFFGVTPLYVAGFYAVSLALLIPYLQKSSKLSLDSLLGILLPFSMGLSVLLFSFLPGYQPELMTFLFGNILSVTWENVNLLLGFVILAALILYFVKDKILAVTIDPLYAKITGVKTRRYEALYHVMLALTILAGVKLVGVILMNALLVIPASAVSMHARSLKTLVLATPAAAALVTISGIIASALLDTPSGATIAVLSGLLFAVSLIIKTAKAGSSP